MSKAKTLENFEIDNIVCGIYKITSPNNKVYIGQSIDIKNRLRSYKGFLAKGQPIIHRSLKKYGWKNHKFEIIEECEVEDLNCRERYWQDYYDVLNREKGLNCALQECEDNERVYYKEGYNVIDYQTKEKLGSIREVANKENISETTLRAYLAGLATNPTNFILEKDFEEGKHPKKISKTTKRSRKVICLNTNKEYKSAKEYSKNSDLSYHMIQKILTYKCYNHENIIYLDEYKSGLRPNELFKGKPPKRKSNEVIDLNNNKTYSTVIEFSKTTEVSYDMIVLMLSHKAYNTLNIVYKEDIEKGILPNSKYKGKRNSFKIKDLDTGIEYSSIRHYSKENNLCNKRISECLKNNNCEQNIEIID